MYLVENPVLQRELLVNLRMPRAFILLFAYVLLLGGVVYLAWPQKTGETKIDMSKPAEARRLVDLFFLGQFTLASLMAPSFAAGAITGEKERKTYEMLLASPLKPGAIVTGKLLASLCHLAILIFSSLPIVMLCLPLGGVSIYEVAAAYLALLFVVTLFGMVSIAASSFFRRTAASLVVSYLLILPVALVGIWGWWGLGSYGVLRLWISLMLVPGGCITLILILFLSSCTRLLHPPDVGSGGKEVVDVEQEMNEAVGLVIRRDQFPDRLFAPAKRVDLLKDDANPVYDKEMRSEIFSQGTLMLRIVIQVSMALAIPLMAFCLFLRPQNAPYYICYVVLFNLMVGPVFSAGSVTSERERQTLELLLTTTLSPWQILWGKLVSGLRVSAVLTSFLLWPVVLACAMVPDFWPLRVWASMAGYLLIVVVACLTTATAAMFCSVMFKKTSVSMMISYLAILIVYTLPLAFEYFAFTFFAASHPKVVKLAEALTITSPFAASFDLPLILSIQDVPDNSGNINMFLLHMALYVGVDMFLLAAMAWSFRRRYRVAF
jgi:ABC-type transport system involved in multi-copper enzyme maturation permease subunit